MSSGLFMTDSRTLTAQCPSCQARYELPVEDAGQAVECVCSFQFVVPGPSAGISITCPACPARYEVEEDLAGQEVECECGQRFTVSRPEETESTQSSAAVRVACPQCAAEYQLSTEDVGTTVECVCGFQFEVPSDETADSEPAADVPTAEDPLPEAAPPPDFSAGAVPAVEPPPIVSTPSDQSRAGTSFSRQKTARQKTARQKKKSPTVVIIGTMAFALAAVLTGVFLMTGSPDSPATETESGQSIAARSGTDTPPVRATSEIPARTTANTADVPSASTTDTAAGSSPESTASTAPPESVRPGSALTKTETPDAANPNALTSREDFVIGASKPGSAASPPARPSAPAPGPPSTAGSSSSSKTGSSNPAAAGTTAAQTPPPPPVRRIEFVAPVRTYRRFSDAFEAAVKQFAVTTKLKTAAADSQADLAAWESALAGTGGLFKSALRQISRDADPQQVLRARLLLTYCYLQAGQFYEAGILGHAIARWTPDDMVIEPAAPAGADPGKKKPRPRSGPPTTAGEAILAAENNKPDAAVGDETEPAGQSPLRPGLEAAGLALAAFVQARETAPADDREAEFQAIVEIATLYETRWPEHEKVDSIRLFTGKLFQASDDQISAAEWYARVSRQSPEFARSRLMAGQACWTAALSAVNQTVPATGPATDSQPTAIAVELTNPRPRPEQSRVDIRLRDLPPAQLKQRARVFLTAGIAAASDRPELAENVAVAQLTLAQLFLAEGKFEETVAALTTGEPTVIGQIGEGAETRPARGVRSIGFARLVYTTLIRARLSIGQLDEASHDMKALTGIAGGVDAVSMAKLHLDLIEEMTRSYRGLAGPDGKDAELLNVIAESFEHLTAKPSALSATTLLRAATAARDLAESVRPPADSAGFFSHAAVFYEALLANGLPDPGSQSAVQFRLADVLNQSGQFEKSLALYDQLLAAQPNVFSGQMKAARALQALGTSSRDPQILVRAITGSPQKPHLWGWGRISVTMQRLLAKNPTREDYRDRFLEARLHIAECRLAYASAISDTQKKKAELEKTFRELKTLAYTTKSHSAPGWQSLNGIYQTVQKSLEKKPQPLYEE